MQLGKLIPGIDPALARINVADIASDSREVVPGGLFLACAGSRDHGLRFLDDAIRHGARVVAWEPSRDLPPPELPADVDGFGVPGLRAQLGAIAGRFFAQPSSRLAIAGITGTNGKTTVAWLVTQALEALGERCGYIGTLGSGLGTSVRADELTTPGCVNLHRRLRILADGGARHVAAEVSSHALDQGRVSGVRFRVAAFTNLSRDHLDYHGDIASYGRAKARLFADFAPPDAVINVGDAFGRSLASQLAAGTRLTAVALAGADTGALRPALSIRRLGSHLDGQRIELIAGNDRFGFSTALVGTFNLENLVVAAGILHALRFEPQAIAQALAVCKAPPGRMEPVPAPAGPRVIVDFAHTPDALSRALAVLTEDSEGEVWCVFGCGGERDGGKRPLMGDAAAAGSSHIVITDDNPRGEDPDAIVAAIRAGIPLGADVTVIRDRAAAIGHAIASARPRDTVLIAGKGHESVQIVGREQRPFSDQQAARVALVQRQ